MLLKIAFGILAVLILRMFLPSLVRGVGRTLLVFGVATLLFGAVVWLTVNDIW